MKKKVPLAIRQFLENTLNDNRNLIKLEIGNNSEIIFKEKDDYKSSFYFIINEIRLDSNGVTNYIIEYVPSNGENFKPIRHSANLDRVKIDLKNWINYLKEYNNVSTVFDDPILQKYYEDISTEIKILDKDAEYAPFNLNQQDRILKFLESAKTKIKSEQNDFNNSEILEIVNDAETIKELISKSTKAENVNRISKFFAKSYKLRFELGKALVIEFLKDGIIFIAEKGIENLLP